MLETILIFLVRPEFIKAKFKETKKNIQTALE